MRIRYSRVNICSLCFCLRFSRWRIVPFSETMVHIRNLERKQGRRGKERSAQVEEDDGRGTHEVSVNESPTMSERMSTNEAVSREISTVPIE